MQQFFEPDIAINISWLGVNFAADSLETTENAVEVFVGSVFSFSAKQQESYHPDTWNKLFCCIHFSMYVVC